MPATIEQDLILRQRADAAEVPVTHPLIEMSMEATTIVGPSWTVIPGTPAGGTPDQVEVIKLNNHGFTCIIAKAENDTDILNFYLNTVAGDAIVGNFIMVRTDDSNMFETLIVENPGLTDVNLLFQVGAEPIIAAP